MSVVLVATFRAAPGKTEELVDIITAFIPSVHTEDGCELYALHRGEETLAIIEKWESEDTLAVHGKGAALADMGLKVGGLLAGPPEVVRFEPIPAGTEAQGTL